MADDDAASKFYKYGARMLFMLVVGAMLCCVIVTGAGMVYRAMPYSVNVKSEQVEDKYDADQDDYPDDLKPIVPETTLIPGGSDIARTIDADVQRHKEYNASLDELSAKTFGAPMRQGVIDRSVLFEKDDDWTDADKPADVQAMPMTPEVTLFSF